MPCATLSPPAMMASGVAATTSAVGRDLAADAGVGELEDAGDVGAVEQEIADDARAFAVDRDPVADDDRVLGVDAGPELGARKRDLALDLGAAQDERSREPDAGREQRRLAVADLGPFDGERPVHVGAADLQRALDEPAAEEEAVLDLDRSAMIEPSIVHEWMPRRFKLGVAQEHGAAVAAALRGANARRAAAWSTVQPSRSRQPSMMALLDADAGFAHRPAGPGFEDQVANDAGAHRVALEVGRLPARRREHEEALGLVEVVGRHRGRRRHKCPSAAGGRKLPGRQKTDRFVAAPWRTPSLPSCSVKLLNQRRASARQAAPRGLDKARCKWADYELTRPGTVRGRRAMSRSRRVRETSDVHS